MKNFDELRKSGGSFVGTGDDMSAYREWAARQVCQHCGAKASDRERDESGVIVGKWWLTETDCGCTLS